VVESPRPLIKDKISMSKYAAVINSDTEYSEELTPIEGIVALATIQTYVDGTPSAEEFELIAEFLKLVEISTEEEAKEIFAKITRVIEQDKLDLGALFNAAIDAIQNTEIEDEDSEDLAEVAIELSVLLAQVDGEIAEEEYEYISAIGESLGFTNEEVEEIVAEILADLYAESEDDEEEEEEEE
jgi:tellurite resistance protein